MKRDSKTLKRKDEIDIDFTNCRVVMSSYLPLLFANGQPRSLETISQPELEEFVPFMVRCSLAQVIHKTPKEVNNTSAPEWWPQGFPFKFPLVEQSDWIDRLVMLKSLVCRCYTFYNCEFLLKFSSELAEMAPSQLRFEQSKEDDTTSIFDPNGSLLVKCRNENLNYDVHKNHRRYLSPAHRSSLNQAKKYEPVIDLTFDTSSEDEKEVYFKETAPTASRKGKRKSIETDGPTVKRRVFNDFPQEKVEPTVYTQEQYMAKLEMIPLGKQISREVLKVEKKKRLANSFSILSISSRRGQELLMKNKHSFNLESSLERIDRFCSPTNLEEPDNNQMCTRAAASFSALYKQDEENKPEDDQKNEEQIQDEKWCHTYKWPRRTNRPIFPHMGPCLKECTVRMNRLTDEEIKRHCKRKIKISVSTMTPDEWWSSELAICKCQLVQQKCEKPLFIYGLKYKHKKSSTRCTCGRNKSQHIESPEGKIALPDVRMEASSEDMCESQQDSPMKSQNDSKSSNESKSLNRGNDSVSSLSLSPPSPATRRALWRRPLAVVPSTPPASPGEAEPAPRPRPRPLLSPPNPQAVSPTASLKINFTRSILDAIKWYTKDDRLCNFPVTMEGLFKYASEEESNAFDPSQENIKPLTELTFPNVVKPMDYFQQNLNVADFDYCFKRNSNGTSKLVTRRGERKYFNREPCPSCYQGRENFCVFEFVRQAKLAGLELHENQKQLQSWFFNFITIVNKKAK